MRPRSAALTRSAHRRRAIALGAGTGGTMSAGGRRRSHEAGSAETQPTDLDHLFDLVLRVAVLCVVDRDLLASQAFLRPLLAARPCHCGSECDGPQPTTQHTPCNTPHNVKRRTTSGTYMQHARTAYTMQHARAGCSMLRRCVRRPSRQHRAHGRERIACRF